MDTLASASKVFVWFHHPQSGSRVWVTAVENTFDKKLNRLVLRPNMDDDPAKAQSFTYEFAARMRSRFTEDLPTAYDAHFSLDPTGAEVGASFSRVPGDDTRVPMQFRGLIATPGFDVKLGRVWYCKFPNTAIESCRGESPEEAINKVYERGPEAVKMAEQAPPPPAPEPPKEIRNQPRQRPGDRY